MISRQLLSAISQQSILSCIQLFLFCIFFYYCFINIQQNLIKFFQATFIYFFLLLYSIYGYFIGRTIQSIFNILWIRTMFAIDKSNYFYLDNFFRHLPITYWRYLDGIERQLCKTLVYVSAVGLPQKIYQIGSRFKVDFIILFKGLKVIWTILRLLIFIIFNSFIGQFQIKLFFHFTIKSKQLLKKSKKQQHCKQITAYNMLLILFFSNPINRYKQSRDFAGKGSQNFILDFCQISKFCSMQYNHNLFVIIFWFQNDINFLVYNNFQNIILEIEFRK